MALPTIVPVGFAGDYTDFLKVKCDHSGAVRRTSGAVAVPAASAAATLIGLMPFNSGFSFAGLGGYNFFTDQLDTGSTVTLSIGVAYATTTDGTDALTLVTNASTGSRTSGGVYVPPSIQTTWQSFVSTGNGWVVASLTAGPTTTLGNLTFNIPFVYDQPLLVA